MNVVIADAQKIFRTLLSSWIAQNTDWVILLESSSGTAVLQQVARRCPDILIVDPLLPGVSGFELAHTLKREHPQVRQLALYGRTDAFLVDRMRKAGFHACIHKGSAAIEELSHAVTALRQGQGYYCAETCRVQNWLYNEGDSFARLLSGREQQVLSMIGAGMRNPQIAAQLGLSPATIQTHRRNLFRKLKRHDTPSLIGYALTHGFWHPDYERLKIEPWEI